MPPGSRRRQHQRVLIRRDVEEAVEFVAEDVEPLRELPGLGVGEHLVPHVERVLVTLRQLFRHQLPAPRHGALLRLPVNRGRVAASCRRRGHRAAAFPGNRGDEAVEVLLLRLGKPLILQR
jgi:hypothetical protein